MTLAHPPINSPTHPPIKLSFTTALQQQADDPLGWNGRLLIPADVVSQIPHREDGSLRVVCALPDLPDEWHGALTSDGQGGHYIIFNKQRIRALEKKGLDKARLRVTLVPDESRYGAPMPPELAELLAQDPHGDRHFHGLTPGRQRNLIYMIAKYKSEATRLEKAVGLVDYLVEVRGALDFRELNEYWKARR